MTCPRCGLINPDTALKCDCGYEFSSTTPAAPPPPAPAPPAGGVPPPTLPPPGPPPPAYPTYAPPPGYQWPAAPQPADSAAATQLKGVGVVNIVTGGLSLAWALLMVVEVIAIASGALDEEMGGPDDPPKSVMVGMFVGMFVLAGICGALELIAGIALLRRTATGKRLGYVAAVLGLVSVWGCCVWPLCAAGGLYTLVVLQKPEVGALFEESRPY